MRIIIIGAGELGRLLALTLQSSGHDVILVDSSQEELEKISGKLDVMTVEGSCASVTTLKKAGVKTADALLAVSGDEAANILSCQIASRLGVRNTICRLYRSDTFSEKDGIGPEALGIGRIFSPPEECAEKISLVLKNGILLERIRFGRRGAQMAVFEVERSSILAGIAIKNIPGSDILKSIRFAAILRDMRMIVPHGDTILAPGDKVYVAGKTENINAFLDWISPNDLTLLPRLIIAGSDETGCLLAQRAMEMGFEVRFIEPDKKESERLLDILPSGIMMLNGDPTEEDVLEEAGISAADVFVNVSAHDEENILSCILAKRLGARKVISLTHKPEYIGIVPALGIIDCGFSASIVSVNTILRLLEEGTTRVDTILQRVRANLSEFKVSRKSPLCGKALKNCRLPSSLVLAMIFRGQDILSPAGDTVLEEGDTAVAIVTEEGIREIEPLFPEG